MNNTVPLSKAIKYSSKRTSANKVKLSNFISIDNILQNKAGITTAEKLPPSNNSMPAYDVGHILVGNIRPYLKKIWFANKSGGCSADVLNFEVNEGFDARFVYYNMLQDRFFNHMMKGSKGSKMPRGDKTQILDYLIPLFDKKSQEKISSILFSIDQKIELNNKISAELEQLAKTVYDYWFVQFDFPDANGKPYKSSGGKMVWNEELKREIPEGWEVGGFDDIGHVIGGSTPSTTNYDNFTQDGIPWITPKDLSINTEKKFISRGEIDVTEQGFKSASLKLLPKGSVLLSSRAPIGYIAIARNDVSTNQGFKSLVPSNSFSTEFVFHTVQLYINAIKQYASGSTFSEISAGTLNLIKFPLPDINLVQMYTEKVQSMFLQQNILEQENEHLQEIRDWLLPMLMNGQVTIKEDDDNNNG